MALSSFVCDPLSSVRVSCLSVDWDYSLEQLTCGYITEGNKSFQTHKQLAANLRTGENGMLSPKWGT